MITVRKNNTVSRYCDYSSKMCYVWLQTDFFPFTEHNQFYVETFSNVLCHVKVIK